jgi:dimethylhistidine N-methyltransferase
MQLLERSALRLPRRGTDRANLTDEVLAGLERPQKELPSKLLYDTHGSDLFEQICELEEYYPTRTELAILRQHAPDMARLLGRDCLLIEYGSGSGRKARLLLDQLASPVGYVPIDISRTALEQSVGELAAAYPHLEVLPVCADYTQPFELPRPARRPARVVVFFPGSTIGNFEPAMASQFLRDAARLAGPGGGLLIGVDRKKEPWRLHRAYNDGRGVTAAFNLNILERLNRELGADFRVERFEHYAFYNPVLGRIEMHLVSLADQQVHVADRLVHLRLGESIWTESSYKFTPEEFTALAAAAGWSVQQVWTDAERLFSVQYLTVEAAR